MKQKRHVRVWLLAFFLLLMGGTLVSPPIGNAQGYPSWWGSNHWWDWSDFRGSTGIRFWMPRLMSGSVSWRDSDHDLLSAGGYNFQATPDFFKEGWFILNVDRLALRAYFEEDHRFNGLIGTGAYLPYQVSSVTTSLVPTTASFPGGYAPSSPNSLGATIYNPERFSELDVGWTRFGLDLDLIRYPFLRAGINVDRNFEAPIFINRQDVHSATAVLVPVYDYVNHVNVKLWDSFYDGRIEKLSTQQPPVTIGVHFLAIPATIWEIPVTIQGRGRIPMPLINQLMRAGGEAKVTDWEISAGFRPNVWHTSLLGYATFAMGTEVGFRSISLDMFAVDGTWRIKANWQGGFVQVGAYF